MSHRTLIIDNDEMNRRLLRLVLEHEGYHCVEAENGATGLSLLASQQHFDVVILDHAMPGMTGIDVLDKLQHTEQRQPPPIIMVTGWLHPELREKARQFGAFAILEKPYDLGALRSLIAGVCTSPALPQSHPRLPQ